MDVCTMSQNKHNIVDRLIQDRDEAQKKANKDKKFKRSRQREDRVRGERNNHKK